MRECIDNFPNFSQHNYSSEDLKEMLSKSEINYDVFFKVHDVDIFIEDSGDYLDKESYYLDLLDTVKMCGKGFYVLLDKEIYPVLTEKTPPPYKTLIGDKVFKVNSR